MIIVLNKDCQMSNRLLLNAHCLATALECEQDLQMCTFGDLAKYYECKMEEGSIKVEIKDENKVIGRIYRILRERYNVYRMDRVKKYIEDLPITIREIKANSQKKHFIHNWYFRNYRGLEKYQKNIRNFFEPKEEYKKEASKLINRLHLADKTVVAVHIRHGDYLEWQNGRFYFPIEAYLAWIENVRNVFEDDSVSLHFILFSNTKIISKVENMDDITISNLSAVEDQFLMSQCDYIMGPPSTFSWWASFMGKKPYCVLLNTSQVITKKSFSNKFTYEYNSLVLEEIEQ